MIAPSILVDDLELHPIEEELPKLPVVPPPTLAVKVETRASPAGPLCLSRDPDEFAARDRCWRRSSFSCSGSTGSSRCWWRRNPGPKHHPDAVRADDSAGAAADDPLRRAGRDPDRIGPDGERRRGDRDARGGRFQPQGDRARHAVRGVGDRAGRARLAEADAVFASRRAPQILQRAR